MFHSKLDDDYETAIFLFLKKKAFSGPITYSSLYEVFPI